MGRVFFVIILAGMVLTSVSSGATYGGGSGTSEDPYQIATKEDLLILAATTAHYSKYFILTADIDLEGQIFTTAIIAPDTDLTNLYYTGPAFTGVFDGNGHKILNFAITSNNSFIGFFGKISGTVQNLRIENYTTEGFDIDFCVGGLASMNSGTISNCSVSGTLICVGDTDTSFQTIGGLVGGNDGTITHCYSEGAVDASMGISHYVGGLVGFNAGSVYYCYSTANVSGYNEVGGLVGYGSQGSLTQCCATGQITGNGYVGGLIGCSYYSDTINQCYATGAVTGNTGVGGLAGYKGDFCAIDQCYAAGKVTGNTKVDGLVGYNYWITIDDSFWDVQTSGITTGINGIGKTTAEMKTSSTFTDVGWNFDNTWPMWVTGKTDNALSFDGVDDYVEIPDYYGIGGTSARTISLWIKTSTSGVNQGLIQWGSDSSGLLWYLLLQPDGTVFMSVYAAGVMSSQNVTDGQWHHIAAVLDEGQTDPTQIRLYIDGVLDAVPFGSGTINTTQTVNVHLGVLSRPSSGTYLHYYSGLMDDVCIYERALDEIELVSVYQYAAGLVHHWKLDESAGTVANDSAGVQNGTLHNMADNDWVGGKIDNALSFDGVDDYVEVPDYYGIGGTNARTVSLWIKTSTTGRTQTLMQWGANSTGQLWMIYILPTNVIQVAAYGGGVYSTATVTDGAWHHIAAVLDEGQTDSSQIRLYIDGILDATATAQCAIDTAMTVPVQLGAWYSSSAGTRSNYFSGLMDDVCIYDRAVEISEILPDFVFPVSTEGLVAYWTMDEAEGLVAHDSVSSYHGELKNMSESDAVWAICEGTNYPRLLWQIPEGDWVCPDGVNTEDLDYFVEQWLLSNCTISNNYCGGVDMNTSGTVDMADLAVLAGHWLEGI